MTSNEGLADQMLPITKKYLSDQSKINYNQNYKTTYFGKKDGLEINEDMNLFSNYISELAIEFMRKQGYKIRFPQFKPFIFANEMYENDHHNVHSHANSMLSGVFYLQTPEGSGSISFYDPKPRRNFISRETEFETDSNMNIFNVQPKKGLLLIWESWLEHSVMRNHSKDDSRISLVFNLTRP